MDPFFAAVEASTLSDWIRSDLWAFPVILIFHTIGLAFLVGANLAVDARILGGAATVPPATLERYFLVAWAGFWMNAASGVLLLIAYPTKAMTNPLFYAKLALIAVAVGAMRAIRQRLRHDPASFEPVMPLRLKLLAVTSLACWATSIVAGRLLAYTHTRLLVTDLP